MRAVSSCAPSASTSERVFDSRRSNNASERLEDRRTGGDGRRSTGRGLKGNPAAGGGRWIDVAPERVERWLRGFDERHRVLAECHVPFPPLPESQLGRHEGLHASGLAGHVLRERTVGVLLARLGGHAVGVFEGERLVASKVGSRPVHGRNAAGGWSQKRFQRRREGQIRVSAGAATETVAGVLLPYLDRLDALVCGGDRRAVDALRDDPRLRPLFAIATERFLTVPDPRRAVLERTPALFRAVHIRLVEPE